MEREDARAERGNDRNIETGTLLVLLSLAIAAASCGGVRPAPPKLPTASPPATADLFGSELEVAAIYAPGAGPWLDWTGVATVRLQAPQAGLSAPPSEVDFGDGFDGVAPSCIATAPGTWSYDETTGFLAVSFELGDPASPMAFEFTGTVRERSRAVEQWSGNLVIGYDVEEWTEASGSWDVSSGALCDPDDWTGGTAGVWTALVQGAQGAVQAASEDEADQGPPAEVLFVDLESGRARRFRGPVGALSEAGVLPVRP